LLSRFFYFYFFFFFFWALTWEFLLLHMVDGVFGGQVFFKETHVNGFLTSRGHKVRGKADETGLLALSKCTINPLKQ